MGWGMAGAEESRRGRPGRGFGGGVGNREHFGLKCSRFSKGVPGRDCAVLLPSTRRWPPRRPGVLARRERARRRLVSGQCANEASGPTATSPTPCAAPSSHHTILPRLPSRTSGESQSMVERREPTARQMRLATELRRLREAAGVNSRQAAALLGVAPAQITHIESALAGVSEQGLRRLASHYACTDEEFVNALVAMATDRTQDWCGTPNQSQGPCRRKGPTRPAPGAPRSGPHHRASDSPGPGRFRQSLQHHDVRGRSAAQVGHRGARRLAWIGL